MRVVIYALMGIVLAVVQMALIPYVAVHGGTPNLSMVFTVAIGLLYGPAEGGTAGVVLGLITDLLTGRNVGVTALTGLVVGALAGRFAFLRGEALSFLAFFGSAAAAYAAQLAGLLVLRVTGGDVAFAAYLPHVSSLAYSAVLGPVVLAVLDGRVGRRRRLRERRAHRQGASSTLGA